MALPQAVAAPQQAFQLIQVTSRKHELSVQSAPRPAQPVDITEPRRGEGNSSVIWRMPLPSLAANRIFLIVSTMLADEVPADQLWELCAHHFI